MSAVEPCETIYQGFVNEASNLIQEMLNSIQTSGEVQVDPDWLNRANLFLNQAEAVREQLEAEQCNPFYWKGLNEHEIPDLRYYVEDVQKGTNYEEEWEARRPNMLANLGDWTSFTELNKYYR